MSERQTGHEYPNYRRPLHPRSLSSGDASAAARPGEVRKFPVCQVVIATEHTKAKYLATLLRSGASDKGYSDSDQT